MYEQFPVLEDIELQEQAVWQQKLTDLREQAANIIAQGAAVSKLTAIVALAGLMSWCPRCGEWQGAGSEGTGDGAPESPKAPPIAPRLLKAVSIPLTAKEREDRPSDRRSKLTPNSGVLETYGNRGGIPTKYRSWQPAKGHGRKVDSYSGGEPEPDSRPHGHEADFIRGDGHTIPLYEREVASPPAYDSNIHVKYDEETHVYTWTFKRDRNGDK